MTDSIVFAIMGAAFGALAGNLIIPVRISKKGAIVGILVCGLVGGVAGGVAGARLDANAAKNLAAQKQMRAEAVAKYRLVLDKDTVLPTRSYSDSQPVVAYVDGQVRECSFRVVSGEPYVFCGAGVEADRAR